MSGNVCIVCQKDLILDEENVCAKCELKEDIDSGGVPNTVNCGTCKAIVEEDSEGLICDKCNNWYHNNCGENPLIDELYNLLNEAPNNVKWFCDKCIWETEKWIKSFKCDTQTIKKKRGRPRKLKTAQTSFKHFLEGDSEYDRTKEPDVKIEVQNEEIPFDFDDHQWTDSEDEDEERKKVKKKKKKRIGPIGHKPYQCDQCEKTFSYKSPFRKHMDNHNREKSYQCSQCKDCFAKKRALKKHMQTHNGNELEIQNESLDTGSDESQDSDTEDDIEGKNIDKKKRYGTLPYQCDQCEKAFSYETSFKKHIDNHNCTGTYQCNRCQECFTTKDSLKRHMKTHTGKRAYICNLCGKGFPRRDHLNRHKRLHTGEKPYQCTHCGKMFRLREHMLKHERVHTGEKPYQCGHCGKTFARQDNFKTHERMHTGERPYKCNQCGKCFTKSGSLKQHLKSHIGKNPIQYTSPIKNIPITTQPNPTLPMSTTSMSSPTRINSPSSHDPPSPPCATYTIPMPVTLPQSHSINASYISSSNVSSNLYNYPTRPPYSIASSLREASQMTTGHINTSNIPWYSMPSTHTPTIPSSYQT